MLERAHEFFRGNGNPDRQFLKDFLRAFAPEISRKGSHKELQHWAREAYLQAAPSWNTSPPAPESTAESASSSGSEPAPETEPEILRVPDPEPEPDYASAS